MRSILLILCLAGCAPENLRFDRSFLFGTAIAGFQAEMGCPTVPAAQCEDPNSDWYAFITRPELVQDPALHLSGDPPASGPGFFELYNQDLDRAADELHNNAFRLGIEWSRVFPTATDGIEGYDALKQAANPAALAFYHAVFAKLKARGLRPFVTLNHYSLPSWIHDTVTCHTNFDGCANKGWVDGPRMVREISKYAGFLAQEFGGEVDMWATLNEPFTAVIVVGFLFQSEMRTNPPGVFLKIDAAKAAFANMIEAHARMYDAVKAADTADADGDGRPAEIGIVYNLQGTDAANPDDPQDRLAVTNANYLMNQAFLDGVGMGMLDAALDGKAVMREDLKGRLDFLGVNYYAKVTVQGTPSSFFPSLSPLLTFNPIGAVTDFDYPRGIYDVLAFGRRYHVPLYISETGVADPEDNGAGSRWVVQTLTWVKRAINDGIPVKGYFYWTFMDNYEWNHGMNIRMGMYAVDPLTKARRARNAVATYGRIAASGEIASDLLSRYPLK